MKLDCMNKLTVESVSVSDRPLNRREQFMLKPVWQCIKIVFYLLLIGYVWLLTSFSPVASGTHYGWPEWTNWIFQLFPPIAVTCYAILDINNGLKRKFLTPEEIKQANTKAIARANLVTLS